MSRFTQLALPLDAPPPEPPPICEVVEPPRVRLVKRWDPTWRFERAGFRTWLQRLWARGYLHGSELLDDLVAAAQGYYVVETCFVDETLKQAEAMGWILRRENDPTPSQRAFTGLQFSAKTYHTWKTTDGQTFAQFHASHWYFSPNRDSAEAVAFLASDLGARS